MSSLTRSLHSSENMSWQGPSDRHNAAQACCLDVEAASPFHTASSSLSRHLSRSIWARRRLSMHEGALHRGAVLAERWPNAGPPASCRLMIILRVGGQALGAGGMLQGRPHTVSRAWRSVAPPMHWAVQCSTGQHTVRQAYREAIKALQAALDALLLGWDMAVAHHEKGNC